VLPRFCSVLELLGYLGSVFRSHYHILNSACPIGDRFLGFSSTCWIGAKKRWEGSEPLFRQVVHRVKLLIAPAKSTLIGDGLPLTLTPDFERA
jgi:hypothetical protein